MSKLTQVTYCKVTEQRGVKRLWLQGLRLKACGFDKGTRYRTEFEPDSGRLHLVLDDRGPRVVSGRKRGEDYCPIVDVCNADVVQLVGTAVRVRAEFFNGRITFTVSHLDRKQAEREARFKREVAAGTLTEGTVCAGAGYATEAIHDGLKSTGIGGSVSWVIDREGRYLEACDANTRSVTEDTVLFEASLEELEPELLAPVSVLQASLPCTGHSKAGKTKNKLSVAEQHKTDSTAVIGFLNIVQAVQPSIIVSENVREAQNSASYLLIKGMLDQLGYTIHEIELGPEQTGSMEVRRRYWFVAVSMGLSELDLGDLPYFKPEYQSVGELLEPVADDDPQWSDNIYLKDKQKRDKAAGKGFANRPLIDESSTAIATAPRTYQKRQSTSPMLVRGDGKERLLTPLELCRAHSAPEYLIKGLSNAVAYEALGQSIDYRQGLAIGMVIGRDLCDGKSAVKASAGKMGRTRVTRTEEPSDRKKTSVADSQLTLFQEAG